MSKISSIVTLAVGGTATFTLAYVGVAVVRGKSLNEVPPFSWVARPAPAVQTEDGPQKPPSAPEGRTEVVVPPMTAGVLGAFTLPSPFDARELQDLHKQLQEGQQRISTKERQLDARAIELDEWQRSLEEREQELELLRSSTERTPEGGSAGPPTPNGTDRKDTKQSWRTLAPLFEEGDPEELAGKLTEFEPDEAAEILRGLDPERAAAILNAVPKERYKAFLDAWRRAGS